MSIRENGVTVCCAETGNPDVADDVITRSPAETGAADGVIALAVSSTDDVTCNNVSCDVTSAVDDESENGDSNWCTASER